MSYDAFLAAASAGEAARSLTGRNLLDLRVLFGSDLLLVFGPRHGPVRVVLATEPSATFYLLPNRWAGSLEENSAPFPPVPALAAFVRLLEVRLNGRAVAGVSAYPWERTVELSFGPREGLRGSRDPVYLVHEAAPKPARLVLLGPDRTVVGAWPSLAGKAGAEELEPRLRHGDRYRPPVAFWAHLPSDLALDPAAFAREIAAAEREELASGEPLAHWRLLLKVAPPVGPLLARAIADRANETKAARYTVVEALYWAFRETVSRYPDGPFEPGLELSPAGGPRAVTALPLGPGSSGGAPPRVVPTATVGEALAAWHAWSRTVSLRDGLAGRLRRTVRSALARAERKMDRQASDLARVGKASDLRRRGELLLANLHLVAPGLSQATVPDYEGRPITIALDPRLSPSQNAQRYFQRYRKAQRASERESPRRKAGYELAWLQGVAFDLERALDEAPAGSAGRAPEGRGELERIWDKAAEAAAAATELRAVEAALAKGGYLAASQRPSSGAGTASPAGAPLRFVTGDGLVVMAGRSARQNEALSLKMARPGDLWFHARGYPGSHVVLQLPPGMGPEVAPRASLLQAAALAAHLSAARGGGKVPVDYTEAKNLRRPKGSPPGLVLYDPHWTVLVDTERVTLPREAGRIPERPGE